MQTYNNILSYIKREMGSKLNLLEMSEQEIIDGINEDILPFYSQYSPNNKYCIIGPDQKINHVLDSGQNQWTYIIPSDPEEYIIDVLDAYVQNNSDLFYGTKYASGNLMDSTNVFGQGVSNTFGEGLVDVAINNQYSDIIESMSVKNTWEFSMPNKIMFDEEILNGVIIYNVSHKDVTTILPDYFHRLFKPLCLAFVKRWISALRSKYESIETPMGIMKMNWNKLESDSKQEMEKIKQDLENIPPDHFIYWSN